MIITRLLSTSSLVLAGSLLTGGISLGQLTLLDQVPSQAFSLIDHVGIESNADNFVVSDASGVRVTEFTIWGTWAPGGAITADTFNVYFHDNVLDPPPFGDDRPGNVVASALGLTPTVTATGLNMPTYLGVFPEYKLDFVLPASVALPPEIWWIEVYGTGSSGTSEEFIWGMAPQDLVNGDLCMSWAAETPGVTWNSCTPFPETDMALQIRGIPGVVGTAYCPGDGVAPHTACPCGNNNNGAMGGCDWGDPAFPEGGILDATGSSSVGANDALLVATSVSNDFGVFFGADNQVNGGNGNPLNDGLRCAGGALIRLIPPTPGVGNQATTPAPVATLDTGAAAGVTRRYQYWFRTPGGPCGQTANLTNGYEVIWMP